MKLSIVPMVVALLLLSSCSSTGNVSPSPTASESHVVTEVTYNTMSADWPVYNDVEELVAAGDEILIGSVTSISYQVLDIRTAEPVTEETEDEYRYFYTIYDVDVVTSYKGSAHDTVKVRMLGGQEGTRVNEQLTALGEDAADGIPLMEGMPIIDVGESCLFVLHQYENTIPTLVNVDQGVYDLIEPYGGEDEVSSITLQDIISFFGEEQWNDFQTLNLVSE